MKMPSIQLTLLNIKTRLFLKRFGNSNFDPVRVRKLVEGKGKLMSDNFVQLSTSRMEVRGQPQSKLAILYVPGGGFCFGPTDEYREFLDFMCAHLNAKGFMLHYRLAPEHPFPAGYDDTLEAITQIIADKHDLVVMSDSAGCTLAMSAIMHCDQTMRKSIKSCVYLSGFFDLAMTGLSTVANSRKDPGFGPEALIHKAYHFLAGHNPCDPKASPFWGDYQVLPPSFFLVGSNEVLLDDSKRIAEQGKKIGCKFRIGIYHKAPHIFPTKGNLPEAKKARQDIITFVKDTV